MMADPEYCRGRAEAVQDLAQQVDAENSVVGEAIAAFGGALTDTTLFSIIQYALAPRKAAMAMLLESAIGFSGVVLLQVIPIIQKIISLFDRLNLERRSVKHHMQICRKKIADVDADLEHPRDVAAEVQMLACEGRRLAAYADAVGRAS